MTEQTHGLDLDPDVWLSTEWQTKIERRDD